MTLKIAVAVKIIVGLALVAVAYFVLLRKSQTSESELGLCTKVDVVVRGVRLCGV